MIEKGKRYATKCNKIVKVLDIYLDRQYQTKVWCVEGNGTCHALDVKELVPSKKINA